MDLLKKLIDGFTVIINGKPATEKDLTPRRIILTHQEQRKTYTERQRKARKKRRQTAKASRRRNRYS